MLFSGLFLTAFAQEANIVVLSKEETETLQVVYKNYMDLKALWETTQKVVVEHHQITKTACSPEFNKEFTAFICGRNILIDGTIEVPWPTNRLPKPYEYFAERRP